MFKVRSICLFLKYFDSAFHQNFRNTGTSHLFVRFYCKIFAVGSPRFSSHCTLAKLLSVYLLSHLTIQQQGDKALIAEIKMSLLPSIQRVVSARGGVGGGEDCTEVFSRVTVLSGTSKCRHGIPGENLQPIQKKALLVEDNTSQTRCCNRASWEMFEQHLC